MADIQPVQSQLQGHQLLQQQTCDLEIKLHNKHPYLFTFFLLFYISIIIIDPRFSILRFILVLIFDMFSYVSYKQALTSTYLQFSSVSIYIQGDSQFIQKNFRNIWTIENEIDITKKIIKYLQIQGKTCLNLNDFSLFTKKKISCFFACQIALGGGYYKCLIYSVIPLLLQLLYFHRSYEYPKQFMFIAIRN